MEQTTLECPSCGHAFLLLMLDPSPNGAVSPTLDAHGAPGPTRKPPKPPVARKRKRSAYHAFLSEQRKAGKSMAEVQAEWRARKAEAAG